MLPEIAEYRDFWPTVRSLSATHSCTTNYDEVAGYRDGTLTAANLLINIKAEKLAKLDQLQKIFDEQKSAAAIKLAAFTLNRASSTVLVRAAATEASAKATALQKDIDNSNAEIATLDAQIKHAVHLSRAIRQRFPPAAIAGKARTDDSSITPPSNDGLHSSAPSPNTTAVNTCFLHLLFYRRPCKKILNFSCFIYFF